MHIVHRMGFENGYFTVVKESLYRQGGRERGEKASLKRTVVNTGTGTSF
jgi:hypothetical protein